MADIFQSLLKPYKNAIFEVIRTSGKPLSLFSVEEERGKRPIFRIRITGTPFLFEIKQYTDEIGSTTSWEDFKKLVALDYRYTELSPGFPLSRNYWTRLPSALSSIEKVCEALRKWLDGPVQAYLEYNEIPDYWAEIQSLQPFASSSTFSAQDLEPFTEDEKAKLRESLREFRKLVEVEFGSVLDNLDEIQSKIDYLIKAVDRLNRFDWKGVAMSTIIGIATNMTVDVEMGRRMLALFQQSLGRVIHLLPK